MTATLVGPMVPSLGRDAEGHREFKLKSLVRVTYGDGPMVALACPGLPTVGTVWSFSDPSLVNDTDDEATCLPTAAVQPHDCKDGEAPQYYTVEQTFSTKAPDPSKSRCNDTPVGDPLLEPMKVSGSFSKYTEEATSDRFGIAIKTSSHEIVRGPQVEFDKNRTSVTIEQNVADLQLPLWTSMIDTVNDRPLWGLPARYWKMGPPTWERKYKGQCSVYYTRKFTFEARFDGWERDLLDEGNKVLDGKWGPLVAGQDRTYIPRTNSGVALDARNPRNFIKALDPQGNQMRVVLNGAGLPAGVSIQGTSTTVVAATNIAAGSNFATIANQPVPANQNQSVKLSISIEDLVSGQVIQSGQLKITGFDENGAASIESFDMSGGTLLFSTTLMYKGVTNILIGTLDNPVVYGVGTSAQVTVRTDNKVFDSGNIHVEKYAESNFYLLGIPIVL